MRGQRWQRAWVRTVAVVALGVGTFGVVAVASAPDASDVQTDAGRTWSRTRR